MLCDLPSISVGGFDCGEQGAHKALVICAPAKQYYRPDYMVLCIVMYGGLGLIFDGFIRLLEVYTMPWRRTVRCGMNVEFPKTRTPNFTRSAMPARAAVRLRGLRKSRDKVIWRDRSRHPRGSSSSFSARAAPADDVAQDSCRLRGRRRRRDPGGQAKTTVYQEPRLVPSMRVVSNVTIGQRRTKETRAARGEGVALKWVSRATPGVAGTCRAARLSASLGGALVREPEFLLLDDPSPRSMRYAPADAGFWWAICSPSISPPCCSSPTTSTEGIRLADRILILRAGHSSSTCASTRVIRASQRSAVLGLPELLLGALGWPSVAAQT